MHCLSSLFTISIAVQASIAGAGNESISFSRLTDGYWQIWTTSSGGGSETRWTSGKSDKRHPAWSPDGAFLVYTDSHGAFFRVDRPEAVPMRLLAEQSPISEPDLTHGGRVAYLHVRQDPGYLVEIWSSRLDGEDRRLLTQQPLRQLQPAWSPDGRRLSVAQFDPAQNLYSLVVMNADGSGAHPLVAGTDRVIAPSWSPNGRTLVYAMQQADEHDLWLVGDDGSAPRRLTHASGLDVSPVFSPSGREVLFVSRRSGSMQLWKTLIDGGAPTQITRGDAPCREPAWFAPQQAQGLHVHSVALSSPKLDLCGPLPTRVRFAIDGTAEVELEIIDEDGRVVRTVRSEKELPAGEHELAWDGRHDNGSPAHDGVHLVRIVARNADGRSVWDPSHETGGTSLTAIDSHLDRVERTIRFTMSAPGWVRLRVGLDEGPMLATLLDWRPVVGGEVRVEYPGRLPEPWGDFWALPRHSVWVTGYSFPDNAIVVEGSSAAAPARLGRPTFHERSERELFLHATHARDLCRDPAVIATLEGEYPCDPEGRPIVSGEVTLLVDAASQAERALFEQSRFEVMVFVDNQFLMEDEDSTLPFHYTLDVRDYPEGVHAFLVNVGAYQDHSGAAFVPFRIKAQGTR